MVIVCCCYVMGYHTLTSIPIVVGVFFLRGLCPLYCHFLCSFHGQFLRSPPETALHSSQHHDHQNDQGHHCYHHSVSLSEKSRCFLGKCQRMAGREAEVECISTTQIGEDLIHSTSQTGEDLVHSTSQTGEDLIHSTSQTGEDLIHSTSQTGEDLVQNTSQTGEDLVHSTSQAGEDLVHSTSQTGEDLVHSTSQTGEDLVHSTSQTGAVQGTQREGSGVGEPKEMEF
ncbi:unnamed protein product [Oncorhynchus mykiss]|uniref:Uncharacterized protein n=1 Tax=Oncorhynchus mykiss TaxID=8022 RepID=A0A060WG76_ONCMY|nr:unnamed protein product [Oncorhynchus mykiss]